MCHERWAKRKDELVETSWLRDLRSRRTERQPSDQARTAAGAPRPKAPAPTLRDSRVVPASR